MKFLFISLLFTAGRNLFFHLLLPAALFVSSPAIASIWAPVVMSQAARLLPPMPPTTTATQWCRQDAPIRKIAVSFIDHFSQRHLPLLAFAPVPVLFPRILRAALHHGKDGYPLDHLRPPPPSHEGSF